MLSNNDLNFNAILDMPVKSAYTEIGSEIEETSTAKRRGRPNLKTPYNKVINYINKVSNEELNNQARILFDNNHYQRILFYSWIQTVRNSRNYSINPRYYTPNLIGAPGYGKSGLTYEFGSIMQEWLTSVAGENVKFEVIVRTLSGINDFADIMGIVAVDREEWSTRIAPPRAFPKDSDYSFGIIFLDDFNRGHAHVIAGAMEFVNTAKFNDYQLPVGFSLVAAMNPQGKNHKVVSIDEAQSTRFINLPYAPSRQEFINQMIEQNVDNRMLAYLMKFEEIGAAPSAAGVLPEPRVINWRTLMIFNHMYPVLAGDDVALNIVADSILGPNNIRDLHRILQGEMPLSPSEILGGNEIERKSNPELSTPEKAWESAKAKLEEFEANRRTDLLAVTTHRLIAHLNKPDTTMSESQLNVLAELFMFLPKETALDGLRRLIQPGCPRADHYRPQLTMWNSPDGRKGGPLTERFMNLVIEIRSKIKELKSRDSLDS